jgi:hypothetical protein
MPRYKLAFAAIAATALALTGCGSDDKPESITVTGWITVTGVIDLTPGSGEKPCRLNSTEFRDVETGATVEITDATGKTLAVGTLDAGKFVGQVDAGCRYKFSVPDVPDGEAIYKIIVGSQKPMPVSGTAIKEVVQLKVMES